MREQSSKLQEIQAKQTKQEQEIAIQIRKAQEVSSHQKLGEGVLAEVGNNSGGVE